MKKYIIGIILFLVVFNSCEDYLEKNPNDKPTSQAYFTSEKAAQESRIGLYAKQTKFFTDAIYSWDAMTDQSFDQYNWWSETTVARGVISSATRGIVSDFYSDAYKVIATANDHIANINNMDESLFEKLSKERYIADAQFFKAFYYFYLTELYGGVPLYKEKPETLDDFKVAKTSKADIVTYILAELDIAIPHLPEQAYDGYITRGAAQALKAKILLQNGDYSKAASTVEEIMASDKFRLHSNYDQIFYKSGQASNAEIIFAYEFQYPEVAHSLTRTLVHSAASTPRQEFVDSYLMRDGLTPAASGLDTSNYQNRDPRLYQSVRLPNDIWLDENSVAVDFEPTQTGYYMKKFLDTTITDQNSIHIGGTSEQSIVLLRYADVLLMYAEAKHRLTEFDQTVADNTVNLIRDRVGMAKATNVDAMTDEEKLDLIKYERNIELAFEGHHYFDLKRWGELGTTLTSLKDPTNTAIVWESHFNLWPFTDSELNLNPNLKQNPDY